MKASEQKFGNTAPDIILGANASSPNARASLNWAETIPGQTCQIRSQGPSVWTRRSEGSGLQRIP